MILLKNIWPLAFILLACESKKDPVEQARPNIVLIMTDDQGYGDFGFTGNEIIRTPVCDRLSRESVNFDRFYVSPVCAPTRASLLTGRYHLRTGTTWVTHRKEVMRSDEVTLAESLKKAGYTTGIFGKWHNGEQYPNDPTGQGFDEFFGFAAGHWNNYFNTTLTHNGTEVKTDGYITDVLTDQALKFIRDNQNQPFFCYIPYNAPHGPFQVPDKYFDYYKAQGLNDKDASVYGMCENIDDNVGRILKDLDSLGLAENTIFLFTTDNGPNGDRYNGGMRGRKASVHEGGVRVPLLLKWPGKLTPGLMVPQLAAHIDILPTLLELAGVSHPDSIILDGRSLVPLLGEEDSAWESRSIFTHQVNRNVKMTPGAVRTDQYRLIYTDSEPLLFDMKKDPGEQADIAVENPDIVNQLKSEYETWFNSSIQGGGEAPPIPVGYSQSKVVNLPAPERKLSGGLEFEGGMGWANDWIVGWDQAQGEVTWEIAVANTGEYQVNILYGCSAEGAGTAIEATIGANTLTANVEEHQPEIIPSPDRVKRGEVYEKLWKSLTLGTASISSGNHSIIVTIADPAVMEGFELKALRISLLD